MKDKHIYIHKNTGGFTGLTSYSLHVVTHVYIKDEQKALEEIQTILDKLFPEENIDVKSLWIKEQHSL